MKAKIHLSLLLLFSVLATSNAQWQETTIDNQAIPQLSSLSSSQESVTSYTGEPLTINIKPSNAGVMLSLTDLSFISSSSATDLTITGEYKGMTINPMVFSTSMDEGHSDYQEGKLSLIKSGDNDILVLFDEAIDAVNFSTSHEYVRFDVREMKNLPKGFVLLSNEFPSFSQCDEIKISFLVDRSSSMNMEDFQEVNQRIESIKESLRYSGQSYSYEFRDLSTGELISSVIDLDENVRSGMETLTSWNLETEADVIFLLTDGMPNEAQGEKINLTTGFQEIFSDLNQARKSEQYLFLEPIGNNASMTQLQQLLNRSSSVNPFSAWLSKAESCEKDIITLSPNPTNGILYITGDLAKIKEIRLIDASGNVLKEILSPQKSTLDLSALPSGVYQVQIHKEGKMTTRPLIKID